MNNAGTNSGLIMSILQYKGAFQIAFVLGMVFYWAGIFVIVYHLIRFGTGSLPKKLVVIFLTISVVLSIMTGTYFFEIFKNIQ